MAMPGFTAEAALYQTSNRYRVVGTVGQNLYRAARSVGEAEGVHPQGIVQGVKFHIARCTPQFQVVYVVCGHIVGPQGVIPIYCQELQFLGIVCN